MTTLHMPTTKDPMFVHRRRLRQLKLWRDEAESARERDFFRARIAQLQKETGVH